jgi:DNA-binding transcriptional regulator YhcF (GntR family)
MYAQIPLEIMRRTDMSANSKLMYARIAFHIGKNECAWPSRETLSKELGIHLSSVKRALNELSNAGLIQRQQRGHNRTNEYRIVDVAHIQATKESDAAHPRATIDDAAHQRATIKEVTRLTSEPLAGSSASHIKETPNKTEKKERVRGARIKEDWKPDESTRQKCIGISDEEFVDEEVQNFIDHWIEVPGQRGIKKSWERAFQTWIRRGVKWGRNERQSVSDGRERRRSALADAYSERMESGSTADTLH